MTAVTRDLWAVVPAAGVGRRMGTDVPKQYLALRGRPVIEHALSRLLAFPRIAGVCVAIGEDDGYWAETAYACHPDVTVVVGGAERRDSVINALTALSARASPDDWVLVHDAARPCVRLADIERLVERVTAVGHGGLLGRPVHDTMKRSDATGSVLETVDRTGLWHAFTPQMFRLGPLLDGLTRAIAAGVGVTDEAGAMEWAGEPPVMVEGHADNLKITRAEDLALADYLLSRQEADSSR
jgi:2-C-methyl-D-erythritol 4-phosphate cytidylyltransferase